MGASTTSPRSLGRLRDRCRVSELVASPDGTAVTGVRFAEDDDGGQELPADLVIDASGRGAPTLFRC